MSIIPIDELIFFRGVETTNQIGLSLVNCPFWGSPHDYGNVFPGNLWKSAQRHSRQNDTWSFSRDGIDRGWHEMVTPSDRDRGVGRIH